MNLPRLRQVGPGIQSPRIPSPRRYSTPFVPPGTFQPGQGGIDGRVEYGLKHPDPYNSSAQPAQLPHPDRRKNCCIPPLHCPHDHSTGGRRHPGRPASPTRTRWGPGAFPAMSGIPRPDPDSRQNHPDRPGRACTHPQPLTGNRPLRVCTGYPLARPFGSPRPFAYRAWPGRRAAVRAARPAYVPSQGVATRVPVPMRQTACPRPVPSPGRAIQNQSCYREIRFPGQIPGGRPGILPGLPQWNRACSGAYSFPRYPRSPAVCAASWWSRMPWSGYSGT